MKAPKYIESAGIIGAPLNYKWSNDIEMKLFGAKDQNVKLYKLIDESSFKAKMALGIAATEWLVFHFEGHAKLTDVHQRLEAAWANVVVPVYSKSLRFKLTPEAVYTAEPNIDGPLKLMTNFLGDIRAHYATGVIYLAEPVVKQVMLVKQIIPGAKPFEEWLSSTIRGLTKAFPRAVEYDKKSGKYDASHEKPVPRELFEPGFDYSETSAKMAISAFLKTLDPKANPYLRTPEEMKAEGFKGEPYKY